MKRQHEEKDMDQRREAATDLEIQMRILKRQQELEKDAGSVQTVVLVGLWLLTAVAVIIYAM